MIKNLVAIVLGLSISTLIMAQPNVSREEFAAKLSEMAGEPGQFYFGKEVFPKDYFLVPRNLPFLAGLALYHPQSANLNLSKEQIQAIKKIKEKTVPVVMKAAKKAKSLELTLAQNIAIDTNTAKSQYGLVEEISKIRTDLTKSHLQCINEIREVLTKEQYKELLKYATKLGKK